MEPIQIPIEDVLDLHTFRPQDIANLAFNQYVSSMEKARASKKNRYTGF
jgi:hypothetical protein